MAASTTDNSTTRRLLRFSLALHKKDGVSEEDFHRYLVEQHAVPACKLHQKNGLEGYQFIFTPKTFQQAARDLSAQMGDKWRARDHDVQADLYFRDWSCLKTVFADPEFHKILAEEGPWVSEIHAEHSIGWVEVYVKDGKVVNIGADGKSTYPSFAEASVSPVPS